MVTNPIKTLIVDDHLIFREGLVSLLSKEPDFTIVGQAGTVRDAITRACELQPDLVLLDMGLPDGHGVEAVRPILANKPDTKIVFLTVYETDDMLFSALRRGAKGYLLKNIPVANLLESLRALQRGEAALSRNMVSRVLEEFSRPFNADTSLDSILTELTERQLQVLAELTRGATNEEIAARLVISENTVKNHVHTILKKLQLRNRREAVKYLNHPGLKKYQLEPAYYAW
jgi:DNA-binding NarL/FixJ family response regulator